jgi:hypothetical protein
LVAVRCLTGRPVTKVVGVFVRFLHNQYCAQLPLSCCIFLTNLFECKPTAHLRIDAGSIALIISFISGSS